MNKAYDNALQAWATHWRREHIEPKVSKLITLATYDLWYGPEPANDDPPTDEYGNENEWAGWPGFFTVCDIIKQALQDIPRELYVDIDIWDWQETSPEPTKCDVCDGTGMLASVGADDGDEDFDGIRCFDCNEGYVSYGDTWYKVDRIELKRALVGKELAQYV